MNESDYEGLVHFLNTGKQIDLSGFARPSLYRRITRFCDHYKIHGLSAFKKRADDEGFLATFIDEITVDTTEFYRDPAFWDYFQHNIIPELQGTAPIRFYHIGCSTGEEIVSLALLLNKFGLLKKSELKAVDLNPYAIVKARQLSFPKRKKPTLMERCNNLNIDLSDFFVETKDYMGFDPELFQGVKFSKLNVLTDKNFNKYDVIFCRHVLLYFKEEDQQRIVKNLKANLFPGGFLLVGAKEDPGGNGAEHQLTVLSGQNGAYRYKR